MKSLEVFMRKTGQCSAIFSKIPETNKFYQKQHKLTSCKLVMSI